MSQISRQLQQTLRKLETSDRPLSIFQLDESAQRASLVQKPPKPTMSLKETVQRTEPRFELSFDNSAEPEVDAGSRQAASQYLNQQIPAQLNSNVAEMSNRFVQQSRDLSSTRDHLAQTQYQNVALNRQVQELQKKLQDQRQRTAESVQEAARARAELETVQRDLRQAELIIDEFRSRALESRGVPKGGDLGSEIRIKQLMRDIDLLSGSNKQLLNENAVIQAQIRELSGVNVRLAEENDMVKKVQQEAAVLRDANTELSGFNAKLLRENQQYKAQIELQIDENVRILEASFQFMNQVQQKLRFAEAAADANDQGIARLEKQIIAVSTQGEKIILSGVQADAGSKSAGAPPIKAEQLAQIKDRLDANDRFLDDVQLQFEQLLQKLKQENERQYRLDKQRNAQADDLRVIAEQIDFTWTKNREAELRLDQKLTETTAMASQIARSIVAANPAQIQASLDKQNKIIQDLLRHFNQLAERTTRLTFDMRKGITQSKMQEFVNQLMEQQRAVARLADE